MGNEAKKTEFLAVAKWACKYAGVKILFDSDKGASANVPDRIIHMPKRMAVAEMPMWIATLIHEAMHVKHTPAWLGTIPRDDIDHRIMNALEDERIERIACKQLRAFHIQLARWVEHLTAGLTAQEQIDGDPGMQVLGNFACKNSGMHPFTHCYKMEDEAKPIIKQLQDRHNNIITKVTPTAFKQHLAEYYKLLDQLRAILKLKHEEEDNEKKGEKGAGEACRNWQEGDGLLEQLCGIKRSDRGQKPGQGIEMEGMAITEHSIPLDDTVRERVKAALRKSTNTTDEEGNCLDTDELIAFMTGDIDELFYDTKTEKKMKTKVYFLMDVSGSMGAQDMSSIIDGKVAYKVGTPSRLDIAHGAFRSLQQIIDELKEEDGCDIDYEAYVFATRCKKWDGMKKESIPNVGGGTDFYTAMEYTTNEILKEDPTNKRILVVITDGEVYQEDVTQAEKLLLSTGQDVRAVFVQIGDSRANSDFFRHQITGPETADVAIFESFEEAL